MKSSLAIMKNVAVYSSLLFFTLAYQGCGITEAMKQKAEDKHYDSLKVEFKTYTKEDYPLKLRNFENNFYVDVASAINGHIFIDNKNIVLQTNQKEYMELSDHCEKIYNTHKSLTDKTGKNYADFIEQDKNIKYLIENMPESKEKLKLYLTQKNTGNETIRNKPAKKK